MSNSLLTLYYFLGGIFTLLTLATSIVFILRKRHPQRNWLEIQQRVNSWWIITCLFSIAMTSQKEVALFFWGFISFLSLKEYITLTPTRRSDSTPLLWMYIAIPLQYIWIGMSWYGMFIIFIPVYVFLFLPIRMVIVGDTRGFLHSASIIHWGMMTTVFALSHVAFLMMLPSMDTGAGALLVIFLVATTEFNDIAQYLWGKSLGKTRITPDVSPNKTWAGFLGGVLTTTLIAVIFGPMLTPMNWIHSLGAGLIIGLSGFF
ncbi:phosphatidate cytidylyltransferase, partial [Escherichia coli]|nr:phosphatidate cytidylyltransferase [Escherichia coli]